MSNTILPLLWLFLAALLLAAVLWPQIGLLARWQAEQQAGRRRLLEDALKLLYNTPRDGPALDQALLARDLRLNERDITRLVEKLAAQGLVTDQAGLLTLSAEGQRWALQVIRAHRLWERYLADEARMPLEQIHSAAHRREHQLTLAEVDQLDADLGHPTRDPHGDPIPNAAGDLRDR